MPVPVGREDAGGAGESAFRRDADIESARRGGDAGGGARRGVERDSRWQESCTELFRISREGELMNYWQADNRSDGLKFVALGS